MKLKKVTNTFLICLSFIFLILTVNSVTAFGNSSVDNLAIEGYDAVAYFKAGQALKGNESFILKWHGMTWRFITKVNRDMFAASPDKYAPQYDGYCAWAMTEARKAKTDPEVWKIVNGKLYLNCSRGAFEKWSKDYPEHIQKADKNWLKISGKN